MHPQILSFALFLLLAGCASPPNPEAEPAAPPPTISEPALQAWSGVYNLSLFGAWNALDFNGHIESSLGYHNCIFFTLSGTYIHAIEAEATWTSRTPTEERASLFHAFWRESGPYDIQATTGASPLRHVVELGNVSTVYGEIGIRPAQDSAGFGTAEPVEVRAIIHYSGNEPKAHFTSSCGSYRDPL
jgi:hypothetical protein